MVGVAAPLVLLLAAGCAPVADDEAPPRPNILLIVADDLGYTDLGAFGGEIRTPNLDALASEGLSFTQFHTAPQCAPTRAMLLSGNNNHVAGADPNSPSATLSDRVVPFPRLLRDAGYRTLMVGKWHLGSEPDAGPVSAGFERSFALAHGAANHFNAVGMDAAGSLYTEDGAVVEYPEGAFTTDLFTDRLIELIGDGADEARPFFAMA